MTAHDSDDELLFTIAQARLEDVEEVMAFGRVECDRNFAHYYDPVGWEGYLNKSYNRELFVSWVSDPRVRMWIARRRAADSLADSDGRHNTNREIVGYLVCGPNSLPLAECNVTVPIPVECGEIKRCYVHPSAMGFGLAQRLMDFALDHLRPIYGEEVFLDVFSLHDRPIRFYQRNGFVKVGEYVFELCGRKDIEYILRLQM